ncbi:MAG: DUF4041 domain-containing protein [Deltaproteobacteria bacterium]|nr:DUF4041 domain-containing protein [Deltaproteobacteria bacterium]
MEILLILLLVAAIAAGAWLFRERVRLTSALQSAAEENARRAAHLQQLEAALQRANAEWTRLAAREQELASYQLQLQGALHQANAEWARLAAREKELARYQTIVDAGAEAARVRAHAQSECQRLRAEAEAIRDHARSTTEATIAHAHSEAAAIVAKAHQEAQAIAGEAYAAMQDAKRLEQTAQAMRNIIEGYGDRYVVPTVGLLDELADELGFAEAGQRLKAARQRTRDMIAQGGAANCDYVEANRRATAIEFVLDAFNGKVDTILADVKEDNFGTLERKIRDAFTLVNHNGRAFRDARIEPDYLAARLEELRWACVALELKNREREEQRALKERIREEERAQKEYERALKEAEKEQEMLRKAVEKARREVEKGTSEQKARYEAQLRELEEKLRQAEEKGQRAVSMAQQTKSGNVYVISNVGSFGEHVYKIGLTRRLEPLDRVRELGDASVPFEFDVHAMIPHTDAPSLEHALHKLFARRQVNKVNPRKEFFRASLEEIRAEIEKMGLQASWTMAAACREYRESLAIDQALATGSLDERAWAAKQEESERTSGSRHEMMAEALAE